MCYNSYCISNSLKGLAAFFSICLPPPHLSIIQIYILIHEGAADSTIFKNFWLHHFFGCISLSQLFLLWLIPSPTSPYYWRSTSSPEENNFIHWLHLILHSTVERVCVGGQQALYSFLQAASQQSKKHLFNLWKKGGVGFWAATAQREKPPKSASIVWHWRGRWRTERSEQQG